MYNEFSNGLIDMFFDLLHRFRVPLQNKGRTLYGMGTVLSVPRTIHGVEYSINKFDTLT